MPHRLLALIPLALGLALSWAAPAESVGIPGLVQSFVDHGFENVAAQDSGDVLTVWYENRTYRDELTAMGLAARLATDTEPSEKVVELVPQNRSVPLLAVSATAGEWREFLDGFGTPLWFRSQVHIDAHRRASGAALSPPKQRQNRSHWRTDLAVRPLFDFELGIADDPFKTSFYAAPEAVMSPFPGFVVTLQANIRIQDDFDPCNSSDIFDPFVFNCGPAVVPGRNTLSWGNRLPGGWLSSFSGGLFPADRYGFAGEVGRLLGDGRIEVMLGGDATGRFQYLDNVIKYSSIGQWSAFTAATYRPVGIDLETTFTVGRFREERWAARLDVQRRFHEFEVGFFAIQNEDDDVVGVELRIPLPVRKNINPRTIRPVTVPAFPIAYRESVAAIGLRASLFDNLDRMRKRLYPSYILNNLDKLRLGDRYWGGTP